MTLVMLYVLPMLLGRTYDMTSNKVGVDIFPKSAIDNAEVIKRYITDTQYRIVSDTSDARDFLDVSGHLSLKMKIGQVNVEGLGSYLKDTTSRSNMVEILVKVHYETVTLTIPSTANPVEGWQDLDIVSPGTHYARSITYGGDLVASLRFVARNSADKNLIKATVQGHLQAESGAFGGDLKGEFNKIQEKVKNSATLEIHYYATVPIKGVPNDITSLMTLVDEFPKHTQEVNNGLGVPLRMELFPLTALNNNLPPYFGKSALTDQTDLLEAYFDDVMATKRAISEWMATSPPVLPTKHLNEIGKLSTRLEKLSAAFYDVISKLDLSQTENNDQFTPAFDAYDSGTGKLPDKYFRMFQKLKNEIVKDVADLQHEGGGATYIHWGRSTCDSSNTETVYSGLAAGAKDGATELICLPDDSDHDTSSEDEKKHYDATLAEFLNGGRQKVYEKVADKVIPCALCRVTKKFTTSVTVAGTTACAKGKRQYSGYIMSTDIKTRKKEFICVDGENPETHVKNYWYSILDYIFYNLKEREQMKLVEATVQCGTLPCDTFPSDSTIPCAICSY